MANMAKLNGYDIVDNIARNGVTTAGTGAAYTATVPGITSLKVGANFVMIPHTVSTTTAPTLNVNGLSAKTIRRRISNSTSSTVAGQANNWLAANKPVKVTYDGTYWIVDFTQPNASDIYGTVPVSKGGTGGTTAAAARTNLGLDNLMRVASANGYWGMVIPSGTSDWVRTTLNGIIPYQSGGYSNLGTSSWPFFAIYANSIYVDSNPVYSVKVLYSNWSGTTGTVTLNEAAENFSYIEIFYSKINDGNWVFNSTKVYMGNTGEANLMLSKLAQDNVTYQLTSRNVKVSGTSITNMYAPFYLNYKPGDGAYGGLEGEKPISICHVIGYKG